MQFLETSVYKKWGADQYASENFQQLLRENRIEPSMSRKSDCWDNAAMESFFHSLKTECVYHERYLTRDEARKSVFDYMEVFYNRQRKHSYLGYKSPDQYEQACKSTKAGADSIPKYHSLVLLLTINVLNSTTKTGLKIVDFNLQIWYNIDQL